MNEPGPILVVDRFPEMLDALLALLSSLSAQDWARPTVCSRWSVKDVALHLLGDEIGILSRKRDGERPPGPSIQTWGELVAFINQLNDAWVQAARRISSRLLCDLLRFTGMQVCEYFRSLDPNALGDPVDWAGPAPAPVWLDLAREYTERWHHQQQIRDAVGKPGLTDARFLTPVLETFIRALPHTYREVAAEEGTVFALTITGDSGGRWFLLRRDGDWRLGAGDAKRPRAELIIDQDAAWRLFSKGLGRGEATQRARILGQRALAEKALEMVSVIA